jgi:1,4-alpha-glucan branching enzyme
MTKSKRTGTGRASVDSTTTDSTAKESAPAPAADPALRRHVDRLLNGEHHNPHEVLGVHPAGDGVIVRVFHPAATDATVVWEGGSQDMQRIDERGLFETRLPVGEVPAYWLRMRAGLHSWEMQDPYRFLPTLGELDLHLVGEGTHRELWCRLGARVIEHQGARGTAFAVWAPNARAIRVVSDASGWDDRLHPMRSLGASGVWELFLPGVGEGTRYKYQVIGAGGRAVMHADPMARRTERPPATASIVDESHHRWQDGEWMQRRATTVYDSAPLSIYEVHLGSWRRRPDEGDRPLTYLEAAEELGDYCADMGFTHVEFMPLAEHPFTGSWGYQVTGYYAPTARYGTPDELRAMIDALHRRGIGVILDWVPAHFPRDEWALARFDGTALYEHVDPRLGEHPDWGTLVFNFGRNEVRNFLVANARYWMDEFHIDGLRVDAVASMLYLDYSRKPGEWVPNPYGGRENLDAINFLRETNDMVQRDFPGALMIAEESTAWPGVSRPTSSGGLGFSFKWNMGWMHDTLEYMRNDPVFRRYHHHELTFGLLYAWSERFVLPLSHDEVVHGKGSLIGKMPGDLWQKRANLRALLAWMWAHPGKQLLFMGGEIGQFDEWSHDRSIDWHLLEHPEHEGIQRLVRDLNLVYRDKYALFERDVSPEGFRWLDAGNADQNVISFLRQDAHGHPGLACVANFSPLVHENFRVGLPLAGRWREVINTDAGVYGGADVRNWEGVETEPQTWHGQPFSTTMHLPPLAVMWLEPVPD